MSHVRAAVQQNQAMANESTVFDLQLKDLERLVRICKDSSSLPKVNSTILDASIRYGVAYLCFAVLSIGGRDMHEREVHYLARRVLQLHYDLTDPVFAVGMGTGHCCYECIREYLFELITALVESLDPDDEGIT